MKNMWRVILSIVLIMILIGIVIVAVGFLTGADTARLMQTAENNKLVELVLKYYDWISGQVVSYWNLWFGA